MCEYDCKESKINQQPGFGRVMSTATKIARRPRLAFGRAVEVSCEEDGVM